ncbi:DNA/RNA non-specific endonuclease [Klebsiella aerogenes]|nr:DNA/RNA non-specific endonuclease [Klebsiella aerogenes]
MNLNPFPPCLFLLLLLSALNAITPSRAATAKVDNCEVGCPTGGSQQTLFRAAYTLNNNPSRKLANWVAYKITRASEASNRERVWKQDPDLPAADTLAPADYRRANTLLAVDRGHQAPLASLGGAEDWPALNYLSNITPQEAALNQGAWAQLEDAERALAERPEVTAVYAVTGPLFERHIATLPAAPGVEIPSGYWKIIFLDSGPQSGQYAAFVLDQATPRDANFCDHQVTVAEIERRTSPHLTLWSALPAAVATTLKTQPGRLAREMGCR